MTLEEILNGLEGLKDLTNDPGKRAIDVLKSAVRKLVEEPPHEPVNYTYVEPESEVLPGAEQLAESLPASYEPLSTPKKRRAYKRKPAK